MHFRRETNLQDAPREIAVFCRHLPPLYWSLGPICGIGDFGGKIKSPLVPSSGARGGFKFAYPPSLLLR